MQAYDELLGKCGNFGRMQIILLILFAYVNVVVGLHYFAQTVVAFSPIHWCIDYLNETEIPKEPSCKPVPHPTDNGTSVDEVCQTHMFDLYMGYSSITNELKWICEDEWKQSVGTSMFFLGSAVGTLIFGFISDILGRIPVLIIAHMIAMCGDLLTMATINLPLFCLFQFICGLANDSNLLMMIILVMEYLRPSLRTIGLQLGIGIFFCLGSALSPWIAILTGSWRGYLLATALPMSVVPLFYFIIPESAIWLVSIGKCEKALKCFQRIARCNRREVDKASYDQFIADCKQNVNEAAKDGNVIDLFRTPRLRRNTLILLFKFMATSFCYDGMARNVYFRGISPFVLFTLSSLTIFPACLIIILIHDLIGRKAMSCMSLLSGGIFSIIASVFMANWQEDNATLIIIFIVIARFSITVAMYSCYQYGFEIFPACVRGQGLATAFALGNISSLTSICILYTREFAYILPEVIFGVLGIISGVLSFLLPETLNRNLPSTLKDGENFGKADHWYTFSCIGKSQ